MVQRGENYKTYSFSSTVIALFLYYIDEFTKQLVKKKITLVFILDPTDILQFTSGKQS